MDDTFLARWLAGELDNEELKAFTESDPERYRKLVHIKQQFESIERPGFDTEGVLHKILSTEKNNTIRLKPRRRYWLQSVAAAVAIIILGLVAVYMRPEKIYAANGVTTAFILPDKSSVHINSGSEVTYSSRNWDNNREINLNGEAYFKVAKGKTFTVKTPLGNVAVLGTQFNVKARGTRLDVVCYEGRVRVEYKGHVTILKPQDAIYLGKGAAGNVVKVTDAAPAWLRGELVFYHEDIEAVTAEIERKFNVQIQNQYKSGKTFTGALSGNSAAEMLKTLGLIYPVKIEAHNKMIILKPADAKR